MKLSLFVLVFAAALAACAATQFEYDEQFNQFLSFVHQHNKQYQNIEEFTQRFAHFKASLARVAKRNQQSGGANNFGITKFADMSVAEFKKTYLRYRPSGPIADAVVLEPSVSVSSGAEEVDWRKEGAVTAVKDQGQCGSCWAFSTAEEVESMWFLAGHELTALSPQQITSCDTTDGGCNGGDTVSAYAYVKKAGGLESEKAYPYTSGNGDSGTCKFKQADIVAKISGFTYAADPCTGSCNSQNETKLASNLKEQGPVSICVYAEPWQDYTGGILSSGCQHDYNSLDHCVQLVGYNKGGAKDYWIIRNSWATSWGEEGYIYVEMGKNLCGVADEATIVTI